MEFNTKSLYTLRKTIIVSTRCSKKKYANEEEGEWWIEFFFLFQRNLITELKIVVMGKLVRL